MLHLHAGSSNEVQITLPEFTPSPYPPRCLASPDAGLFQKHYLHQIAKGTTRQARINATFRYIQEHAEGCPLRRKKA